MPGSRCVTGLETEEREREGDLAKSGLSSTQIRPGARAGPSLRWFSRELLSWALFPAELALWEPPGRCRTQLNPSRRLGPSGGVPHQGAFLFVRRGDEVHCLLLSCGDVDFV